MLPDLQLEMMPVAALAPYAANARMHPAEQVAQLAASIGEFGFNVPVLVDDAGVLIAGHGRVLAAEEKRSQDQLLDEIWRDSRAAIADVALIRKLIVEAGEALGRFEK